jgi:hypothetical protein
MQATVKSLLGGIVHVLENGSVQHFGILYRVLVTIEWYTRTFSVLYHMSL